MKQPSSSSLFVTEKVIIVLGNVAMTTWNEDSTELQVFFAQGPHISLVRQEARDFVESLTAFYQELSDLTGYKPKPSAEPKKHPNLDLLEAFRGGYLAHLNKGRMSGSEVDFQFDAWLLKQARDEALKAKT